MSLVEPSASVSNSASDGDPKKTRKIDGIKEKLFEMLREIGFRLPDDHLPWSMLEDEVEKAGYMMVNWPEGVAREKDKSAHSLGAEEADKLYHALFLTEDGQRLRFVRRGEESVVSTVMQPPGPPGLIKNEDIVVPLHLPSKIEKVEPEPDNCSDTTLLANASGSANLLDVDRSHTSARKQTKSKATKADGNESHSRKRRRAN